MAAEGFGDEAGGGGVGAGVAGGGGDARGDVGSEDEVKEAVGERLVAGFCEEAEAVHVEDRAFGGEGEGDLGVVFHDGDEVTGVAVDGEADAGGEFVFEGFGVVAGDEGFLGGEETGGLGDMFRVGGIRWEAEGHEGDGGGFAGVVEDGEFAFEGGEEGGVEEIGPALGRVGERGLVEADACGGSEVGDGEAVVGVGAEGEEARVEVFAVGEGGGVEGCEEILGGHLGDGVLRGADDVVAGGTGGGLGDHFLVGVVGVDLKAAGGFLFEVADDVVGEVLGPEVDIEDLGGGGS